MFCATNIVKYSDKTKYVYRVYEIEFDGAGTWNFSNNFSTNFVIFSVDDSSSSHTDNRKNNFLVLGEGWSADDLNDSVSATGKKYNIKFTKAKKKFARVCIVMMIVVIYSLTEKILISLKSVMKIPSYSILSMKHFWKIWLCQVKKVSFKGNVHGFVVDYDAIDESDITNIHLHLING